MISGAEEVLRGHGMDLLLYSLGHVEGRERYFSDVAGGRTAVQHLVNLGHERIALISGTPGDPMGFTSFAESDEIPCSALAFRHRRTSP